MDIVFEAEFRQSEACCRECVSCEDVRSSVQILPLDAANEIGLRKRKHISTASEVALVIDELLTPEFALRQL